MVRRSGKKSRKMRGSRTHGWGAGKKHRGKGEVGGKGYAWCKHFWIHTLKYDPEHFGKHGFRCPTSKDAEIALNVGFIDEIAERLLEKGLAKLEGNRIKIDAGSLKIDKILGSGSVNRPIIIIAGSCSPAAKDKIEKAGGEIRLPPEAKTPEAGSGAQEAAGQEPGEPVEKAAG